MGKQTKTSLTLSQSVGNETLPHTWQALFRWHSDEPEEAEACDLVLQVVRRTHLATDIVSWPPQSHRDLAAGQWRSPSVFRHGQIRFTFDGMRTVYADLRNGRFSLGSWRTIVIEAAIWGSDANAQNDTFDLNGWIQAASDGDWLRYTCRSAGSGAESFNVPPGAAYVDVFPAQVDPATYWGEATAPSFRIDGRAESARHDYSAMTFCPTHRPLSLLPGPPWLADVDNVVTVTPDATRDVVPYQVVFYVR